MLETGTSGLMSGEGKPPAANRSRSSALPRLNVCRKGRKSTRVAMLTEIYDQAVFNQVDCKVCTYRFAASGKQHLSLSLTPRPFARRYATLACYSALATFGHMTQRGQSRPAFSDPQSAKRCASALPKVWVVSWLSIGGHSGAGLNLRVN
jgi:hypothetical protein